MPALIAHYNLHLYAYSAVCAFNILFVCKGARWKVKTFTPQNTHQTYVFRTNKYASRMCMRPYMRVRNASTHHFALVLPNIQLFYRATRMLCTMCVHIHNSITRARAVGKHMCAAFLAPPYQKMYANAILNWAVPVCELFHSMLPRARIFNQFIRSRSSVHVCARVL